MKNLKKTLHLTRKVLSRLLFPLKHLSKRNQKIVMCIALLIVIVIIPVILYSLSHLGNAEAAWFNTNWSFRKAIPVTSTNGSTQSNVFISFTLDTASLITAGKLQSNCQDIRVTNTNGKLLKYHVGRTNPCNNASTTIDVLVPSFINGQSTYFVYYGNPSAPNADAGMYLSNIVTASGNEITDAVRTTNIQGDGVTPPDSSYGIWQGTTNLIANGGFETNTTGWSAQFGGENLSRVTSDYKFGTASLQVIVGTGNQGINTGSYLPGFSPSTTYTFSAWIKDTGAAMVLQVDEATSGYTYIQSQNTTVGSGTGLWRRINYTFTTSPTTGRLSLDIYKGGTGATTFYIDGIQLESGSVATPYVETNGATAARSAAKVQVPASLLNASQGWVAMRMRYGSASTTTGRTALYLGSGSNRLSWLDWTDGAMYQQAQDPTNGFSQSAFANSFAKDGLATYVMKWAPGTMSISINGGAFTTYASGKTLTTIDTITIGSDPSPNYQVDGDILWTAGGTGTVTDADAANINNFGNTDPTPNSGFGDSANKTFVWNANYIEALNYIIGTLASEEVGTAPVAYWKFDEGTGTTANDSSSNKNNGTLTNSPTWQAENQCISGKCLYFDGSSNNYVDAGNNWNFATTDSFTVSAWFKTTSLASEETIIAKGQNATCFNYAYLVQTNGAINFGNTPGEDTIIPAGKVSANTWYHFEAVYVNGSVTGYLNGIVYTTASRVTSTCANSIKIGSAGGARLFTGYIDDVKIFKYARSSSQIKADFNSRGSKTADANVLGASTTNQNLSNGLVGYWKMDESSWNGTSGEVIDSSGNGNNGTAAGGATTTAGKFGNGGSFTSSSKQVNVSNSTSLNITGPITLSAWVYVTACSGQYNILFWKNLQYTVAASNCALTWADSSNWNYANFGSYGSLGINAWHHIVATKDANNIVTIYLDGQIVVSKSFGGTITGTTNSLGIADSGNGPLTGNMDEARVYNRALSPSEVAQLYNFAPGPIAYWNFEEGSGLTANDSSGNGITGTWHGTGKHQGQGKYGKGAAFNGIDDYVSVTSNAALAPSMLTVGVWAKSNTSTWNDYGFIVSQRNNYIIHPEQGSNTVSFYIYNGSYVAVTCTPSSITVWHYYSLTWDGTNLRCYIDGVLGNSSTPGGSINTTPAELDIGKDAGISRYMNGTVDEVKIYNYARTQKQIVSDMNANHPNVGSPVGSALGYWKFDEGFGTVTHNSGNGGSSLDGILGGMSSPATVNSGWSNDGKFGKTLGFNGTNGNVTTSGVDLTSGDWTMSAWVYPTLFGAQWRRVFEAGATGGYGFGFASGSLEVTVTNVGDATASTVTPLLNQWSYIAATFIKSSNTLTYYVNGKMANSVTFSTAPTGGVKTKYFGGFYAGNFYAGFIDEAKIYSYALNASDVKLDYNHGATQVLGSMSNTSGLAGGNIASNSASAAYCIPGDTTTCNSPVGEWNFEEGQGATANDSSGNANTGTLNANTAWKAGKIGKALIFDGSGDYVSTSNTTSTQVSSGTMEAWIKTSNAGSGYRGIVVKQDAWGMFLVDNVLEIFDWTAGQNRSTGVNLADGKWHHVVVSFQSGITNGSIVYVDGIAKLTTTMTVADQSQSLSFGTGSSTANGQDFNGLIDQVRLFNYVRTPAQVAWDYNRGGPVGWWKFDECQGTTLNDSSGNGNSATLTIGATGSQTAVGTCLIPTDGTGAWYNGASGKYNSSLSLDGTDDFAIATDPNSLKGGGLTISTWYKTSSTVNYNTILNRGAQGNANGFVWFFFDNSTKDKLWYQEGNASYCSIQSNAGSWSADGNWHNLAVTQTTTGSVNFYKDGNIIGTGSCTWQDITNNTEYIGTYNGNSSTTYTLTGQIDDLRTYNYALTKQQVQQIYNQGAGVRFGPLTGSP